MLLLFYFILVFTSFITISQVLPLHLFNEQINETILDSRFMNNLDKPFIINL